MSDDKRQKTVTIDFERFNEELRAEYYKGHKEAYRRIATALKILGI